MCQTRTFILPFAICVLAGSFLSRPELGVANAETGNSTQNYQEMLIWTGDYDGMVDGIFGSGTKQAIKNFQKRFSYPASGNLTQSEATLLQKIGENLKTAVGFVQVNDDATGVSVGMPLKLVMGPKKRTWGQNWSSADDTVDIDTFRYTGETLQQVCDRIRYFQGRRIDYFRSVDDWCVIGGTDRDGADVYVRATAKKPEQTGDVLEIRGFSLRLSGVAKETLENVPAAMSSSFSIIQPAAKAVTPASLKEDLLKTPTSEIKASNTSATTTTSGRCFNGLGDCPPNLLACLKDPKGCPTNILPGHTTAPEAPKQ